MSAMLRARAGISGRPRCAAGRANPTGLRRAPTRRRVEAFARWVEAGRPGHPLG